MYSKFSSPFRITTPKATTLVGAVYATLLCGCLPVMPHEYRQQIVVPICKINCVIPDEESIEVVVWGEDEMGRSVCHTRPSSFTGSDAVDACNATRDAYCNFARIRQEQEIPASSCELVESYFYSRCVTLTQDVLARESPGDGALTTLPKDFPKCNVVIDHD